MIVTHEHNVTVVIVLGVTVTCSRWGPMGSTGEHIGKARLHGAI
jgi:hypothetical protein